MPELEPADEPNLVISPWDATKGLLDATQIWSEFLTGQRGKDDWAVAGAFQFFECLGIQAPSNPISVEVLISFRCMVQEADRARTGVNFTIKANTFKKMDIVSSKVGKYFSENCNMKIDNASFDGNDRINKVIESVGAAVSVVKTQNVDPSEAFSMFVINNNSESFQYSNIEISKFKEMTPADDSTLIEGKPDPVYWEPQPTEKEFAESIGETPGGAGGGAAEPGGPL